MPLADPSVGEEASWLLISDFEERGLLSLWVQATDDAAAEPQELSQAVAARPSSARDCLRRSLSDGAQVDAGVRPSPAPCLAPSGEAWGRSFGLPVRSHSSLSRRARNA